MCEQSRIVAVVGNEHSVVKQRNATAVSRDETTYTTLVPTEVSVI